MKITRSIMTAIAFMAWVATNPCGFAIAGEPLLIRAEALHIGTGEVLRPGSVLINDGKIVEVGEALSADDAKVVEVKTLIPGLVDASARTGVRRLDDEQTEEITPDLSVAAIVDWNDREFLEQIATGTTCVHLTPGTSNVIAGLSAAVKTAGRTDHRMISDRTGLLISVCSDPASGNNSRSRPDSIYVRQPTNRMGVVWMLRNSFQSTGRGKNTSPALNDAASGALPIFAVSRTQYDIQALMTLADEFQFHPILCGGQECWKVTNEIANRGIPVILHRGIPGSYRGDERTRVSADIAARLNAAGAMFCLSEGDLLDQMRYAVRFGLPAESALATVTSNPAKILKLDDRVGSIVAGKDADLVALNGDLLEFTTDIQWVMVDGAIQFEQAGN